MISGTCPTRLPTHRTRVRSYIGCLPELRPVWNHKGRHECHASFKTPALAASRSQASFDANRNRRLVVAHRRNHTAAASFPARVKKACELETPLCRPNFKTKRAEPQNKQCYLLQDLDRLPVGPNKGAKAPHHQSRFFAVLKWRAHLLCTVKL